MEAVAGSRCWGWRGRWHEQGHKGVQSHVWWTAAFRCANPLPKPPARVEGRDAPATTYPSVSLPCHTLSRHPAKHKPAWSALPGAARAATVEWAGIGPPWVEPPRRFLTSLSPEGGSPKQPARASLVEAGDGEVQLWGEGQWDDSTAGGVPGSAPSTWSTGHFQ